MQRQTDCVLALIVTNALRDISIGESIECQVLAAPMDPDVDDAITWQPARLGIDSGIVQLVGASGTGILNHEQASGTTLFLRLPVAQIEVPLANSNRVGCDGLVVVRRVLSNGGYLVS